jgi:hypothetical protein
VASDGGVQLRFAVGEGVVLHTLRVLGRSDRTATFVDRSALARQDAAMAMVTWELHYDRRLDPAFLSWFRPGGVAHSLVDYVRLARFPLDLQFRKDAKTGAQHATLYAGLTAVLKVSSVKDKARLTAHPTWANAGFGFGTGWGALRDAETWKRDWSEVEIYLEKVIPRACLAHGQKEGAIQAAVSGFDSSKRVMLDREVVMAFRDNPVRTAVMHQVSRSLIAACAAMPKPPNKPKQTFGPELDVLAIDADGRLLAVEVKPDNVATIPWAGAQAEAYARLLRRWIAAPDTPESPLTVLRDMNEQRKSVELLTHSGPTLPDSPQVVPVVAVPRGANPRLLAGLQAVQDHLERLGEHQVPVELYEVSLTGRMERLR